MYILTRLLAASFLFLGMSICPAALLYAQGGAAAVFLTINPSPMAAAMGRVGVAYQGNDPFAAYFNPAHVGQFAERQKLELYPGTVRGSYNTFVDFDFANFAVQAGYTFDSLILDSDVKIGAAYYSQFMDEGLYTRTTPAGEVIGNVAIDNLARAYCIGAGIDIGLEVSFGLSLKTVTTTLYSMAERDRNSIETEGVFGEGTVLDYGVFMNLPIITRLEEILDVSLTPSRSLKPDLDLAVAYAMSNTGGDYIYASERDAMPRTSTIGYAVQAGLDYAVGDFAIRLIDAAWSIEASDMLVERDSLAWAYQAPFADSDIWQSVFLADRGAAEEQRRGWRVEIGETFSFAGGENVFATSGHVYQQVSSSGFGLRLKGLLAVLNNMVDSRVIAYAAEHIDLQYVSATLGPTRISNERNVSGVIVRLRNFL